MLRNIKTFYLKDMEKSFEAVLSTLLMKNGFKADMHNPDVILTIEGPESSSLSVKDKTGRAKYLSLPFSIYDLLALIHKFDHEVRDLTIGPYLFSYQRKEVSDGLQVMKLREKEAEILLALQGRIGQILTKEEMLETIWGYQENIVTTTLETHIYRLRKKLKEAGIQIDIEAKEGGYTIFSGSH